MSRTQAQVPAQRGVAGAGPRPAGRARGAVLRPGRGRAADRGGRGHPDRVRHYRADRHPGRVPRGGGDSGHLGQRVRRDDEAHQKRRSFYAFISAGLGRVTGVAAALVALLAYSFLQVGLYGAFGPNAAAEASAHLELHAAWWAWALAAWAVVTVLGLARIEPGGGFVEEQDARSHDEARGQVKPAAHAARILLDRLAAGVGQAELAEQLVSPAPRDICGQVVQAPEHHQVLAARESHPRRRSARRARCGRAPGPVGWSRRTRRPQPARNRGTAGSQAPGQRWSCPPRSVPAGHRQRRSSALT